MIDESTVFIVGAGASADYGFPLGQGLVERVVGLMSQSNTPLLRALHIAGIAPSDTEGFRRRLVGSDPDSIDTFLEANDEKFVQIGKYAITYAILESEAQCKSEGKLIEHPPRDHWLKYLWNILRTGCDAKSLGKNSVSFVTYNYDRLLETYFDNVIMNAFGLDAARATSLRTQALPVIHVHGQIAKAPFGHFDTSTIVGDLPNYAAGIRVVHDSFDATDKVYSAARDRIRGATLICCLGFGYHPVNVERLRINDLARPDATIIGTTYEMGAAEVQRARSALVRQLKIGSGDQKCVDFLKAEAHFK